MPNHHDRTATRHFCFDVAGAAHEYFRLRVFTSSAVQGRSVLAKSLGGAALREMRRLAAIDQPDGIRTTA
jgi:hypothetical protein